jgi:hypothetical protein
MLQNARQLQQQQTSVRAATPCVQTAHIACVMSRVLLRLLRLLLVCRCWLPALGAQHALCAPALAAAQVGAREEADICRQRPAHDGGVLPVPAGVGHMAVL